jgi:hypothetical protein
METFELIKTLGVVLGGIALVYLIFRTGLLSFIYDAKVDEDGINFVILSFIKISTLLYSNIERVSEVGFLGTMKLNAYNFSNRSLTKAFLIEKKSKVFTRYVIITPADKDYFKMILNQRGINFS